MDASWSTVVKVKYGDILRRFTINVREGLMDYDVNKLKAKISALFNLSPDTNYSFSYTDEDNDIVTLVNDEELYDAVIGQRMDPLRINIQLSSEPSIKRNPAPTLATAFNEALKSVPEPVKSVLSKVSSDLASKASETSPAVAEFVEFFSKLGLAYSGPSQPEKEDTVERKQSDGQKHAKFDLNEPPVLVSFESTFKEAKDLYEKVPSQARESSFVSYPRLDDVAKDEVKADEPPLQADTHASEALPSWEKYFWPSAGYLSNIHRGVRCDGCGMHPIMGPRFKSTVKKNYDLCIACFSKVQNKADFTRIDRGSRHGQRPLNPRGLSHKMPKGKLDSRFVADVTIIDGTCVAPLAPFTKIWRMRNNGMTYWPAGTQLVWIGGDQFADATSITLELSLAGHPVGSEIDVGVDFTAPSRPGRYISYWRMASPYGQKFGQRVWVLIQVSGSHAPSTGNAVKRSYDLNLPPIPQSPTPEWAPTQPTLPTSAVSSSAPAPGETSTGVNSMEETLLKELCSMGFEKEDLNREILRASDYNMETSVDELCAVSEWDPMLQELEEMGFCDREKNKWLLAKNKGSIKRVVLDLVAGEMTQ